MSPDNIAWPNAAFSPGSCTLPLGTLLAHCDVRMSIMFIWLLILSVCGGEGAGARDVAFRAKDGSEQRYVLVLPEGFEPEGTYSVLVALHGHGSDRWQFVKDGRAECRAAREAAAKQRMIYVSPDYRAKTSWMGPAAEADLLQILEELRDQYRVAKVVVSGGSMGGTAALTFAALHPDQVDGVVSMNGTANLVEYDQFQAAIAESYGGSKQDRPEEYRKRSAELHAERLTMPIAATTGGQDKLVPPDSVLRLIARLQELKRPVLSLHRPEGGHATTLPDAQAAFDFVLRQLKIAPRAD
jgi:dipeptidyl aminopeptidase/acylaminoacyl peptidase